jgi:hypothetical protein
MRDRSEGCSSSCAETFYSVRLSFSSPSVIERSKLTILDTFNPFSAVPPIPHKDTKTSRFCFEAKSWPDCVPNVRFSLPIWPLSIRLTRNSVHTGR